MNSYGGPAKLVSGANEWDVRCELRAAKKGQLETWAGELTFLKGDVGEMPGDDEVLELLLPGGRRGKVILTYRSGAEAGLTGSGPKPF